MAIASPTSPAPRGVVRLCGANVSDVLGRLGLTIDRDARDSAAARRFESLIDLGPPLGAIPVSVLWWPNVRSYTGQPSAELHTIGSLPLLTSLVEAAIRCGARAARPGEFTMRAFLSGRLDLTQAEAVLGVIEAEGRGSLNHALRQLAGNLSRPLEQLRSEVLDLLADVEAGLDFVDEDIEFISDEMLAQRLAEIDGHLASTWQLMQQRGGGAARPVIALRGEPNAGKSCLLNRLAESSAAIVADLPGTTRDVVTADAIIGGRVVTLVDTAGIEEGRTEIDRRSQDQAERASREACVRLWCVDQSRSDLGVAAAALHERAQRERSPRVTDLWVATKSDLAATPTSGFPPDCDATNDDGWLSCSAVTGHGIDELRRRINAVLADRDAEESGSVVGTAARCRDSLQRALSAVGAAIRLTHGAQGHEFVATELRTVAESLGEVTGAVYTDDILDRVFSRFCIGK